LGSVPEEPKKPKRIVEFESIFDVSKLIEDKTLKKEAASPAQTRASLFLTGGGEEDFLSLIEQSTKKPNNRRGYNSRPQEEEEEVETPYEEPPKPTPLEMYVYTCVIVFIYLFKYVICRFVRVLTCLRPRVSCALWTRDRREEFEAFVYKPAEGELAADGTQSVSAGGDASRSEADAQQGEGHANTENDASSNTEEKKKKQEPAVDTEVKEENEKQEKNDESKSQVSVERELDVPHLTQKALDRELVHTKIRGLCWKVAPHPHHHSPVTPPMSLANDNGVGWCRSFWVCSGASRRSGRNNSRSSERPTTCCTNDTWSIRTPRDGSWTPRSTTRFPRPKR
jgi:hypothetical protein